MKEEEEEKEEQQPRRLRNVHSAQFQLLLWFLFCVLYLILG